MLALFQAELATNFRQRTFAVNGHERFIGTYILVERPASAISLGKAASVSQELTQSSQFSSAYPSLIDGTPPSLPALPEPELPCPSSSVRLEKSGLSSPPATNPTGSGVGEPVIIAFRAIFLSTRA